ncbi:MULTISPECIES: hypothetical protein [unclassified Iodidimonas]|jgi:hypothetical protein|uniref:hypothetical protein n=1 Tax=unclassified Iodidimonas TaxID=2626145 RepID=UPI0024824894|nr:MULTISPECIES: hypothetical protein [unclassified Iodidimonas]
MTKPSDAYLILLQQVECALDEALLSGRVPKEHSQHDELEAMRREVAAVRKAMLDRNQEQVAPPRTAHAGR